MGRAVLIVVLLVSTIYAGIVIQVQKEMYKIPGIIVDNFNNKDVENVSDYALRTAARLARSIPIPVGGDTTLVFNDFVIGHNRIDKIDFEFFSNLADTTINYRAVTYVSGGLPGYPSQIINEYKAEIANSYLQYPYPNPDLYYPVDMPQVNPANDEVVDWSTDNPLLRVNGIPHGEVMTRPQGSSLGLTSGTKCLSFGKNAANTSTVHPLRDGDWVEIPYNLRLVVDTCYTFSAFAKISGSYSPYGTLFWMASNIDSLSDQALKPTGGIWWTRNGGLDSLHFAATVQYNRTMIKISIPITLTADWTNYNQEPWFMYTMVFNRGNLKAYINTTQVGEIDIDDIVTVNNANGKKCRPNNHGMTIGVKDIRPVEPMATNIATKMPLNGIMDNMGFWRRALTPGEIINYYDTSTSSVEILTYIRD